ncbi:acetyl-CoA acetyltransferase [Sulfodiicoccus acidiphilus]|uniref:propanoyl-CoA C-acyltransferase n=1 Tax=Sulfodiicoccus acidiphilus TaxID=1670455 RepID=A0A348B6B5_9CREN|nr:thiolase family protein [Sulfodiicoccus acidiphilus]BBD73717.1 acetyl-CoA acetyltransferase [Sulfodiicoccus acidiphilus]GGT97841.1 acetyl-CoA acetyltransferase [Sulfodiicoccus acidiphilus]
MPAIVSASLSKFGKRQEGLMEIAAEAALPVLRGRWDDVDFVVVSNTYSGEFTSTSGLNTLLTTYLSLDAVPSIRIDNTSGSGGSALLVASSLITSGTARRVLVVGVEKMSTLKTRDVTAVISSLLTPRERATGPSLPSLAALAAKLYMSRYGATREALAQVSVKNHHNGALNPYAHVRKEVTVEEVLSSPLVSDPLRVYEYSPISDGAAALLLVGDDEARSFTDKPVYIRGIGTASMSTSITSRDDLLDLSSVREAGAKAFRRAKAEKVDFAELHDMATVLELVQSEALGLLPRGEAWKYSEEGYTALNGELPLNTSGGLVSKGHPIGASGVAQAVEVFQQLRGEAGQRQVRNPSVGLSLSMAGFGNCSTVTIYGVEP